MRPYTYILPILVSTSLTSPSYAQLVSDNSSFTGEQETKPLTLAQATKSKPLPPKPAPLKPKVQQKSSGKAQHGDSFFPWFDDFDDLSLPFSNKKYSQTVSLDLMAENIGPGLGLSYGLMLSDRLEGSVGFRTNQASLKGKSEDSVQESISISTQTLDTFLSYKTSPWIFPSAGLSMRFSRGQYGWRGPDIFGNFNANLLTADARLSSEWVFHERYHAVIHWLGIGFPMFGTFAVESTDGLEDVTKFYTSVAPKTRIFQELKSQILLNYLNLQLGFSF